MPAALTKPTGTWPEYLDGLDAGIRAGQGLQVQQALGALDPKAIPRGELARVANLAWRSGDPELGARLLHPVVRPAEGRRMRGEALPRERAEYALCLIRLGVVSEGLRLLEGVDSAECPMSLLYRGFGHAARWEYRTNLTLLPRFLSTPGLDPYQGLVARVNLVAALLHERLHEDASRELATLTAATREGGHRLLAGNAWQLSAAQRVIQGNYAEARRFLAEARTDLQGTLSHDTVFVRKWMAIADVLERPDDKSREALGSVREEARSRGHWETIRDCDRYEAIAFRDDSLFCKVYFGTPHPCFRERLRLDHPAPPPLPATYVWRPGDGEEATVHDLFQLSDDEPESLKPGSLLFRALRALSWDFYCPQRLLSLAAEIYPDEPFHPTTSAHRVHEALHRLRWHLKEHRLPFAVEESRGIYRLAASRGAALRLPDPDWWPREELIPLHRLAATLGEAPFRAADAQKVLGLSQSSLSRLLGRAVEAGLLVKQGQGKATSYLLKPLKSK